MRLEAELSVAYRTAEQRHYMEESLAQFWGAADHMFALAADGKEAEARDQIRVSLQAHQAALSIAVARQLVANNEAEQQAGERIQAIYFRVQRQVMLFLLATLVPIVLTSLYLIRSNRRLFQQLSDLSEQRSELAQKLIATQESTLLYISRELHDEFGQILTAIGSMLRRAGRQAPEGSPLRADLVEVSEIAQSTLDKVRSLSQALHPVTLEEAGLESTVDWYLPLVERQNGIVIHYTKTGNAFPVESGAGIHVYRVLQEALNNATRHSGTKEIWVRLRFLEDSLELDVEDHGSGFHSNGKRGIGLVAMRERAELLNGRLQFLHPQGSGAPWIPAHAGGRGRHRRKGRGQRRRRSRAPGAATAAQGDRDGLRPARHQRTGGDAEDSRAQSQGRCADVEHALGGHLGATGIRVWCARLHAEECSRS
jgi:signal transduction histidine kinase